MPEVAASRNARCALEAVARHLYVSQAAERLHVTRAEVRRFVRKPAEGLAVAPVDVVVRRRG